MFESDHFKYRSGGIRLHYDTAFDNPSGLKEGILLEVGFDDTQPNMPRTISSWIYDRAQETDIAVIDNRAIGVPCYHPGYTFVEKLQTVSTKFRQQQNNGEMPPNFLRHYYDISHLLEHPDVITFIGTPEYQARSRHVSLTDQRCARIRSCNDCRTNNTEALSFDSTSCRIRPVT